MSPKQPFLRWLVVATLFSACSQGTDATANIGTGQPPLLLFCRSQIDRLSNSEILLRTGQNLGTARVNDIAGRECSVRLHPDNNRLVLTRERTPGTRASRELYLSSIDGSVANTQITNNNVQDDNPCWSPDGTRIVFATTRNGDSQLYSADADGGNQSLFLSSSLGTDDRDPDWDELHDKIVFARRTASTGTRQLMLVSGDGTGEVVLSRGAPATIGDTETGDRDPAFSPDGSRVVFVRLVNAVLGQLFSIDLTTGQETLLFTPAGMLRFPRFSSLGDRIYLGVDQPISGRTGLRLTAIHADGTQPRLVEPGKQWLLDGVDVLPSAPAPSESALENLSVQTADVQFASGRVSSGSQRDLTSADSVELKLATDTFQDHELAAISCRFTLPVTEAADVLAIEVRIVARVSRSDANTTLRSSIFNPGASRYDTTVEKPNPGAQVPTTLSFTIQSLAHMSLQRDVRFTVIGEIGAGAVAELSIDEVHLDFVRRAPPK
ncbi:MAG: hypothetical protein EXS02_09255 [Planctomycetes bacterium]|nr:hypothetical protein [Planctomycetota bacterium]